MTEPLPPTSPWWSEPGVILTPHSAATTPQTAQRGFDVFVQNLQRYARQEPLLNLVAGRAVWRRS